MTILDRGDNIFISTMKAPEHFRTQVEESRTGAILTEGDSSAKLKT